MKEDQSFRLLMTKLITKKKNIQKNKVNQCLLSWCSKESDSFHNCLTNFGLIIFEIGETEPLQRSKYISKPETAFPRIRDRKAQNRGIDFHISVLPRINLSPSGIVKPRQNFVERPVEK